ncbi:hypothetical protein BGX28_003267 [Mortierella sp. GBA30]|nr:hypothetical protein BGX28_003267 [Mortierella sp. GBA30]
MVTAISTETISNGQSSGKVKTAGPKANIRSQTLIRSQPRPLDFDIVPAPPTSPLPIPTTSSSSSPRVSSRKVSQDKIASVIVVPGSLRPPPRPRSVVSHLTLSTPPSESLPPVPVILHSSDSQHGPSTPTSPISPTTPSFYSSFSVSSVSSLSRSLPSNAFRSTNFGHIHSSNKSKPRRKTSNVVPMESSIQTVNTDRNQVLPITIGSRSARTNLMSNMEEPVSRSVTPRLEEAEDSNEIYADRELVDRPLGFIATRYYGIESSMRWREGVDPIEKRFSSSNGSWRCQDRFAIFFRPGDRIGPDQVVTKTFWSEAWPYPIETVLYGTLGPFSPGHESNDQAQEQEHQQDGHRSDHEGHRRISQGWAAGSHSNMSETQLRTAASFPPWTRSRDPRYITSEGVQKIAKVNIPMPDVAIDQMELVKAPIKVELRIFVLEEPLRVHATADLLGRTVTGTTELYA